MQDIRDSFLEVVLKNAKKNKDIVFMTADMGSLTLESFKKEIPKQFLNVGVAEQNMVGMACGLALSGKRPFCYSIASFLIYRAFEFVKLDVCEANLPVVLVGVGAGLTYKSDGHTHQSLYDYPIMGCLPNVVIVTPHNIDEAETAGELACKTKKPMYVRLYTNSSPAKWGIQQDKYMDVPFIVTPEDRNVPALEFV